MSSVTSIILITSSYEGVREGPSRLSSWLADNEDGVVLTPIDNHAIAGSKGLQCCISLAAVNYLDRDGFLAAFRAIEWEMPESVQLLLKGEHDECFAVYTPCRIPLIPQADGLGATSMN